MSDELVRRIRKRDDRINKLDQIIERIATEFDGSFDRGRDGTITGLKSGRGGSMDEIEAVLNEYATEQREQAEFNAVDDAADNPPEL